MYAYTLQDLISEQPEQAPEIIIGAGAPVSVIAVMERVNKCMISTSVNGHKVTATVPMSAILIFDSPLDMAGI